MRAVKSARLVGATSLAVLAAMAVLSSAVYASASKPGITVRISPASQSIERTKTATSTVTLSATSGFAGPVALTASGLPRDSMASFAPAALTLTATGNSSTATSVLSVTTTSSTPVGSYTLTVTGTSGKVSGSITAALTVYPLSGSLSMSTTPGTVTMGAGSTAVYAVLLTRTALDGRVSLSVYGGLPTGASWSFSPNPATGTSSTLQVTTSASTPDGTYTLYLAASGEDFTGATRYAYASVQLVINTKRSPFTISGNLGGLLAPGRSLPLQLSLSNPNTKSLSVTNLSVTLLNLTRTSYAISHNQACGTSDYAVVQYSGPYPMVVPGSSTTTLTQLGVSATHWPQIRFLDRPVNQDGCKGATLTMAYAGSGQGS